DAGRRAYLLSRVGERDRRLACRTRGQGRQHRGRLRLARRRPLDLLSRSGRQLPGVRGAPHLEARMSRRLLPDTPLLVASHNPGKVAEIIELVAPFGLRISTAAELALPEPEETGATFVANAELKAVAAARGSGLPALADDSGLEVMALGGAPGIYS